MAAALSLARNDFQSIESAIDRFAFLFTDGHPASTSGTAQAASEVKQLSRLITIGIGDDVNKPFLIGIASSPEDYHPAKVPENILTVFGNLQTLYLAGEGTQQSDQGQGSLPDTDVGEPVDGSSNPQVDDYEVDWDCIESVDLEVK
jgi:hypothetical protein